MLGRGDPNQKGDLTRRPPRGQTGWRRPARTGAPAGGAASATESAGGPISGEYLEKDLAGGAEPTPEAYARALEQRHRFSDPPVSSSDQAARGATPRVGFQQACHCRETERTRAVEGTPPFSWCTTVLRTTRQIELSWRVDALLSERDLMEQPIQTAIALTVEPVTHAAGAGGFQRCNTGQSGRLGFTKTWPRRSELGNQGCRCQWTQARNGLERGEPLRDSALELEVELLLLVCQQHNLCGHLPSRLCAVAGKHTLARRGLGLACADACPGGQIRDVRFVRRIARKQQSVQPIADAGDIDDHVLTEPTPDL